MNETILKSSHKTETNDDVLRLADIEPASVASLLANYGLVLKTVTAGSEIPGSFWGDEEAGLIQTNIMAGFVQY